MREFIKNYPNSEHVADAHFWLAEFTLSGEPINYAEAKENYEIVFTRFPESIKAAQALYKLYDITRNVDRNYRLANQYRAS